MARAGSSQERGGAGIKDQLGEICRPAIDPLGQLHAAAIQRHVPVHRLCEFIE